MESRSFEHVSSASGWYEALGGDFARKHSPNHSILRSSRSPQPNSFGRVWMVCAVLGLSTLALFSIFGASNDVTAGIVVSSVDTGRSLSDSHIGAAQHEYDVEGDKNINDNNIDDNNINDNNIDDTMKSDQLADASIEDIPVEEVPVDDGKHQLEELNEYTTINMTNNILEVSIGVPAQMFSLRVDTTSMPIWIQSACDTCTDMKMYLANQSSTSRMILEDYSSLDKSLRGTLFEDSFSSGELHVPQCPILAAHSSFESHIADGAFGIGFVGRDAEESLRNASLFATMSAADPKMTVEVDFSQQKMRIGRVAESPNLNWVHHAEPQTKSAHWKISFREMKAVEESKEITLTTASKQLIIDSTSDVIVTPVADAESLAAAVGIAFGMDFPFKVSNSFLTALQAEISDTESRTKSYYVSCDQADKMPDLHLVLDDATTLTMESKDYLIPLQDDHRSNVLAAKSTEGDVQDFPESLCLFAFVGSESSREQASLISWKVGMPLLRHYSVTFDFSRELMSFAKHTA